MRFFGDLAANLYIDDTNLRKYTQIWLDLRSFIPLYISLKYINFSYKIIIWTLKNFK
jgi:hypothetical protein